MAQITSEPSVADCPEALADCCVSDHAAHVVRLTQRLAKPRKQQRIPRHPFEAVGYRQQLEAARSKLDCQQKSSAPGGTSQVGLT
eukprot:4300833-Pyramimonas_sp.AAC.1